LGYRSKLSAAGFADARISMTGGAGGGLSSAIIHATKPTTVRGEPTTTNDDRRQQLKSSCHKGVAGSAVVSVVDEPASISSSRRPGIELNWLLTSRLDVEGDGPMALASSLGAGGCDGRVAQGDLMRAVGSTMPRSR